MGESSASRLRGDSMTDVIFNGSSARKPVGTASIELVFDNADGSVGGQYAKFAEIAIRRTVSRDGQSTYYLNGTKCRRKDITGIFLGTGLGPRSYSIIEQGMISRLIEAKPEEMRVYIEEAAGISKYKERRRETENRIRHTRENLERLTDLLEEVEKQIKHLDRQAKAAERYKTYKAEERQTSAELLAMRLQVLDELAATHERELAAAETELQSAIASQRRVERDIEQTRESHAESTEHFNEVQGRFYKVGAEIARLEQAIEHAEELRERQRGDLAQATEGAAEIRAHIDEDQAELDKLRSSLTELAPGLEAAAARAARSGESLTQAENAMADWRERWDAFNAEAYEAEQTLKVEHSRIEQWAASLETHGTRRQRLLEDQRPDDIAALRTELAQRVGDAEGHAARVVDAERSLMDVRSQYDSARQHEVVLRDGVHHAQEELQKVNTALATNKALQRAALGSNSEDVERWLETTGLGSNKRLVEVLDVEAGWESAVETVLGTELQSIVVDDIERAANLAATLTSGHARLLRRTGSTAAHSANSLAGKVRGAPAAVTDILAGVRTSVLAGTGARASQRLAGQRVVCHARRRMGRSRLFSRASSRCRAKQRGASRRRHSLVAAATRVCRKPFARGGAEAFAAAVAARRTGSRSRAGAGSANRGSGSTQPRCRPQRAGGSCALARPRSSSVLSSANARVSTKRSLARVSWSRRARRESTMRAMYRRRSTSGVPFSTSSAAS